MIKNVKPLRIAGVGYCVPENVITNDDLTKLYDTSDEWIYTRTGIKTKFDVEPGPAQLNGVVIEIDNETGKALSIQRINIAPDKVIGL